MENLFDLTEVAVWGHPHHGLVRDGTLTKGDGSTMSYPQPSNGDVYLLRVPGHTMPARTEDQLALDAAAHHTWRDYALISGGLLYKVPIGTGKWLFAIAPGNVWLCSFTHSVSGGSATITLTAKRFGVIIDGDESAAETVTVSVDISIPTIPARTTPPPADQALHSYLSIDQYAGVVLCDVSHDGAEILLAQQFYSNTTSSWNDMRLFKQVAHLRISHDDARPTGIDLVGMLGTDLGQMHWEVPTKNWSWMVVDVTNTMFTWEPDDSIWTSEADFTLTEVTSPVTEDGVPAMLATGTWQSDLKYDFIVGAWFTDEGPQVIACRMDEKVIWEGSFDGPAEATYHHTATGSFDAEVIANLATYTSSTTRTYEHKLRVTVGADEVYQHLRTGSLSYTDTLEYQSHLKVRSAGTGVIETFGGGEGTIPIGGLDDANLMSGRIPMNDRNRNEFHYKTAVRDTGGVVTVSDEQRTSVFVCRMTNNAIGVWEKLEEDSGESLKKVATKLGQISDPPADIAAPLNYTITSTDKLSVQPVDGTLATSVAGSVGWV